MLRRAAPVETMARDEFWPPFCPNRRCASHRTGRADFHRHGVHIRKCDRRIVERYRCRTCGRTCSRQTFACNYYLKRPELLPHVAAGLVACSAHRQIARSLGCAPSTVTRLAARLGRHALLVQLELLDALGPIHEPIVYDDFETFVFAQDHPVGIGTAVGQISWLLYGIEWAPLQPPAHTDRRRRLPTLCAPRWATRS